MERSVKSATRAFELLEVFERERRPMRVNALVEKLDAPQSSVSMLLKTLVSEGYMEFNAATREYCPSARVAFFCEWATHLPHKADAIPQALHELATHTGETVLLGRLDGLQMQYITVVDSQHDLRFAPAPGTKRPPHRSAIGIVLMSTMADDQIGRLLRRYNAELAPTEGQRADIEATLREVVLARQQGYYHSCSLATPGAGVIATLLPTPIRCQRLALGVGAPLDRLQLQKRELVDLLRAAVRQC